MARQTGESSTIDSSIALHQSMPLHGHAKTRVGSMSTHKTKSKIHWIFAALLLAVASAFAQDRQSENLGVAPNPAYRVSRGDELVFRFVYTPELNISATVRSDGRVSLPLIGDLLVQGMTVQELTDMVQLRLTEQVKRPQVVININGAGSQRVFVGGEVTKPGVQPLVGPLTALQAVMAAEGLRDTAQNTQVLVLRRGAPGAPSEVLRVDLAAVMAGRDGAQDPLLMPYDVVVVPKSGIASVNLWVDQYLRRTLPFSLGFSYNVGGGSLR
jgi:polysaccharide biosynthesis/export protein